MKSFIFWSIIVGVVIGIGILIYFQYKGTLMDIEQRRFGTKEETKED